MSSEDCHVIGITLDKLGHRIAGYIVLAVATLGVGCPGNTVTIPATDTTPPQAGLVIDGFAQSFEISSDTGSIYYEGGGNQIGIVATGNDADDGVMNLQLTATYDVGCSQTRNNVGRLQWAYGEPFPPMVATQSGQPGDSVQQEIALANKIDMHALINSCAPGWAFNSIEIEITAIATNFANLTSTVTFDDRFP